MSEATTRMLLVGNVLVLALAGGLLAQGARTAARVEIGGTDAAAARRAAAAAEEAALRAGAGVSALREELEMLAANVGAAEANLARLAEQVTILTSSTGTGEFGLTDITGTAPSGQPLVEFTPELRATLARTLAEKGVTLTDDRVVFPGRVILRKGTLEFFAVFPGGKTHESIFLLTGKPVKRGEDGEAIPPEGLAAGLNSALMALGLRPGTPLRLLPGGRVIPASGTPVNIYVEWEEDGRRQRVRGEDMLWDLQRGRTLDHGKFLYVGAYFDPEGYVADRTGDAVAVYSVPQCVIDLDDPRAADDTIFAPCTPRIPVEGTEVDVVFTARELEVTRSWDPAQPSVRTDAGAPAVPPAPSTPEGGGDDGR